MNTSTIALLLYIVALLPLMLLGFIFARRKSFTPHKFIMTTVVILNWVLIAAVMAGSYSNGVMPGIPDSIGDMAIWLPMIHGIIGLVAQVIATYLVLLMWTENTPLERLVFFRIKNIKTPMRITLTLWIINVLLGFGVYSIWYLNNEGGGENTAPLPDATEAIEESAPLPDATEEDSAPLPASTEDVDDDDDDESDDDDDDVDDDEDDESDDE